MIEGLKRAIAGLRRGEAHREAMRAYEGDLRRASAELPGWKVIRQPAFDDRVHPEGYSDFECRFAARHLRDPGVESVLDVGSYRHFVIGLTASYKVTSLDVRPRGAEPGDETVLTGDARRIPTADEAFDAVVSLSAVEHFGLGRYGDFVEPEGDRAGMMEMIRVLAPGGLLIVTTTVTRGPRTVAFNAHRIYRAEDVHALAPGMEPVDLRCFSHRLGPCDPEQVTDTPGDWDVICCCWRKPA